MKTAQVNLVFLRGHIKHGQITKIAQNLNIHPNTLSRKLRGDRSITIDELNAIAKILRIGVDQFITFEEDGDESIEDDNPLSIARFEEAMQEVRQGFDLLGYTEEDALRLISKVRKEREKELAAKKIQDSSCA
ncbi:helix-turn-helix transcriptional regulator [Candidatus Poribacteria bacterium]|nr:helix-turn-helix transcriptional regulator [Candidatus Poribacteria bacterium]